jgi:hypothetical protein
VRKAFVYLRQVPSISRGSGLLWYHVDSVTALRPQKHQQSCSFHQESQGFLLFYISLKNDFQDV